jgi:hypothetical protein
VQSGANDPQQTSGGRAREAAALHDFIKRPKLIEIEAAHSLIERPYRFDQINQIAQPARFGICAIIAGCPLPATPQKMPAGDRFAAAGHRTHGRPPQQDETLARTNKHRVAARPT